MGIAELIHILILIFSVFTVSCCILQIDGCFEGLLQEEKRAVDLFKLLYFKRFFCLVALNLVAVSPGLAAEKASTQAPASPVRLKSPYFIDGVHCSGLERLGLEDEEQLKKAYADDEVAEVGLRIRQQEACESLFAHYGVEKFQYLTPDDLERLVFTLKHSGKFEEVDIRIEKSELQNHVHLMGNFKLYKIKGVFFEGSLKHSVEFASSPRFTTESDAKLHIRRRGETLPAQYVVSMKNKNTVARAPLKPKELGTDKEEEPVELLPEEQAAISRTNGSYQSLSLRINLLRDANQLSKTVYLEMGSQESHLQGDAGQFHGTSTEVGTEFSPNSLMDTQLGLSLLRATPAPSVALVLGDSPESKAEARRLSRAAVTFIGTQFQADSRVLEQRATVYRSLTKEMHSIVKLDMLLKFPDDGGNEHGFGFEGEQVRGAILLEHRLGLPDYDRASIYYQWRRHLVAFQADQLISARGGVRVLGAQNSLGRSYANGSPFIEAGVNAYTDNFDISLGLMIAGRTL